MQTSHSAERHSQARGRPIRLLDENCHVQQAPIVAEERVKAARAGRLGDKPFDCGPRLQGQHPERVIEVRGTTAPASRRVARHAHRRGIEPRRCSPTALRRSPPSSGLAMISTMWRLSSKCAAPWLFIITKQSKTSQSRNRSNTTLSGQSAGATKCERDIQREAPTCIGSMSPPDGTTTMPSAKVYSAWSA